MSRPSGASPRRQRPRHQPLHRRCAARLGLFLAATGLLAGCTSPTPADTELVVFAAASLNQVFTELGVQFEAEHPGVKVKFSFEGSSTLVDQISQGAPADVLATADTKNMDKAVAADLIASTPQKFTSNVLTLIVPKGNPAKITGLDASLDGAKLVICADGVPCGTATWKLAELLGVTLKPVSEESKVTDVRAKVETGQADAGIVYLTDAKASAAKVETIAIEHADQARNDYPIAVPTTAKHPELAADFIALVQSPAGQDALTQAGFGG